MRKKYVGFLLQDLFGQHQLLQLRENGFELLHGDLDVGRAGRGEQVVPEGAAQILGEPVKGVLGHDHIDDLEVGGHVHVAMYVVRADKIESARRQWLGGGVDQVGAVALGHDKNFIVAVTVDLHQLPPVRDEAGVAVAG